LSDRVFAPILNSAWGAGNTAYSIESKEPDVLYLLGSLCYIDPTRTLDESLQFFDSSIENDPNHQWALLYRAHCLHDLERWTDAARAYDNVAPSHFVGPLTWRYELLLEQRAYCVLRSGDKTVALALFEQLLNRWLANPKLEFGMMGIYTSEVATGEFRNQLSTKYDQLIQNDEWAWLDTTKRDSIDAEQTDETAPE
jgi:tetratricopeptide (TPR) repeat protein